MARGGRRQGTPGQAYGNRTDLQQNYAPNVPSALPQAGPAQPAQPPLVAPAAGPPIPVPGSLGTFGPTQRPNEPLTHGLPSGPGGGPEVMAPQFTSDPAVQAAAAFANVAPVHQTTLMKALMAANSASVRNASSNGVAPGGAQ